MQHHRTVDPRTISRQQQGVALVEFALVAVLFFTLLLAIIDVAYLFFGNLSMQHAVREGARYAVTGNTTDPKVNRCDAAKAQMIEQSMGYFTRSVATIDYKVVNTTTGNLEPTATPCGEKNDIVVLTVHCKLPLLTPFLAPFFKDGNKSGVYAFAVGTAMKNEAFK